MIITFVGHGNMHINTQLSEKIRDTIISNVRMQDSVSFYCGGYGDFDNHCATLARSLKSEFQNCEVVFITPYLTPSQQNKMKFLLDQKLYDSTIYPPIENALPRFAITKRNQWMVEQADLIIAYVDREYGGAYKTLSYAKRKNKRIINLAE